MFLGGLRFSTLTLRKNWENIQALHDRAKRSEDKESFTVLRKNRSWRIGVGARLAQSGQPSFFIEVLIKLCSSHSQVKLKLMQKTLMLLKQLKSKGYSLNCEEDGYISCELNISPQNLIAESEAVNSIVELCLK